MDSAIQGVAPPTEQLSAPAEVFNCPNCSRWQPPGTLVCPECETILYAAHLRDIALAATTEENSGNWLPAKGIWSKALQWLPPETKQYAAVQQRIGLIDTRMRSAEEIQGQVDAATRPIWRPSSSSSPSSRRCSFSCSSSSSCPQLCGLLCALLLRSSDWKFGLGFTVAILIHEMGHYIAAKRRGLKVDLPVFLPGLGAYVRWYSQGMSRWMTHVRHRTWPGPLFGLLSAAAYGATARLLHEPPITGGLFSALAHVSAWLNLLNLVPVLGPRRRTGDVCAQSHAARTGAGHRAHLLRPAARVDVPADRHWHGMAALHRRLSRTSPAARRWCITCCSSLRWAWSSTSFPIPARCCSAARSREAPIKSTGIPSAAKAAKSMPDLRRD